MGIWGSIAKGLVGAIPYVGPIIQGGIEAATAHKAANQQVEGGQRAMAIQDKVYADQQRLLNPYVNTGTAAFTTLGGLLGLPSGPASGGVAGPMATNLSSQAYGPLPNDTQKGALTDPSVQPDASYDTAGNWIGMATQPQRATMATASGYGGSAQQHGSGPNAMTMVRLQAPNGEIETVPADQVSHYTQQGAKVLGSA